PPLPRSPALDCSDLAVIIARLRAPRRFLAASGRAARVLWGAAMPGRRRRLLSRRSRLIIFPLRPLSGIALLSGASINVPIVSGLCHSITPFNQDYGNLYPRYSGRARDSARLRRKCYRTIAMSFGLVMDINSAR